ncbi:clostridial hydrophobic W [Enterococcus faecalis TX1346]|uniref:C39 family peptidase n=1 Tax=Enterococcus faecalis TaxID=1351 RepID=UPI0001F0B46F|nr:C39 family peptidase [Enterococcus faecalis]EFU16611.1 clostridial hydrophobic W [Enterococcus faecalis TX1346]
MKKNVITSSMLAVLLSGFLVTPISAYASERSKGTTEETAASETSLTEQQMSSGVTEEMNPSIINSQEETETTSTSSTSDSTTEVSTSEVTTVNDTENSSDDTETTLETSQSNEDTPVAPAKAEEKVPDINYQTHIQDIGWQGVVKNGEISGTSRRSLRLEGIKMNISNSDLAGSVEYRTHVQEIGWQGYVKDNQLSGTSGKSLRLEAIQIRLTGEIANAYDVYYRVHIEDKGWLNWAKNSESAGSQSAAKRLEAIQIKLVKKGEAAPEGNGKAFLIGNEAKRPDEIKPTVNYQTHVQNIGWQGVVKNGEIAGTSGKNLQLEAIKINLSDAALAGNIEYSTHIQNIGWQAYKANGALSGTTGKNLQLEAIKIKLSGDVSRYYDVYYRVHIQDKGWLNWAANGAPAGSQAASKHLEAIQIKVVRKGETAPKGNGKAFLVGNEAKRPDEIKPTVNYQTHVQNIGWQGVVTNGAMAGTSGKNLQLEAIKINLSDAALAGNIEYSTHIQNIGWQAYKANGALSGTTGKNLQLEAIKIKLSGDVSRYYDVYYRVHIQDKGWLNWAANGAAAGSQAASKHLEAIQIKIVRKGETAPKGSGKAFLVGDEARTPAEIANRLRAERLKKKPYYYSQRDPQWINTYIGNYTIGAAGCVPTSLSMILRGSYGYNVNPVSVATRMASYGGLNQRYFGASATDLVITAQSYGRSIKVINDVATLNAYLSEGYPVILYQNVGIGHAIVVHEYKNGYTLTYDPYGRQFYSGWVSTQALWNTPSNDPIDWTEGRPCFVIL